MASRWVLNRVDRSSTGFTWSAVAVTAVVALSGCATPTGAVPPRDDLSAERSIIEHTATAPDVSAIERAVSTAEQAAAQTTDLGVAVLDRVSGRVAVGAAGDEPFYTASLAKLVVVLDILDRRRVEGLAVSEADVELIRRALGPSDDDAMNILWTRFDGAGAAARVSARAGLAATTAPEDPSQWGQMSAPASDIVQLFDYVLGQMPAADRDLFVESLAAAPAIAADGFDQAFGLLAPSVNGPGVAAKQGWMCCFSDRYYLHSAGVVDAQQRYVVALLGRIPRAPGWDQARVELTAVADATLQILTSPAGSPTTTDVVSPPPS